MNHDSFLEKDANQKLESFLLENAPSQKTIYDASWIAVMNEASHGDQPVSHDMEMMQAALEQGNAILERLEADLGREGGKIREGRKMLKKELRQEAMRDLQEVAINFGEATGKWMLFIPKAVIDEQWALIAKEVVEGRLGFYAKVSTSNPQESIHLVCVYVSNFRDEDLVKRVFCRLQELGLPSKSFKLDFFTHLGIYSKNKWGLEPSIYTAKNFQS